MLDLAEFKHLSVHALDNVLKTINGGLTTQNVPAQFKLLILTNFGHIEADLDVSQGNTDDPWLLALNKAVSFNEKEIRPAIVLKNAKITPFGFNKPAHIIEQMALFSDQIVGLSFKLI
jgi:hypothetical protein